MITKNGIIQWNMRGLRTHFQELKRLIQTYDPILICLEELMVKPGTTLSISGYSSIISIPVDGQRAHGGTAILIRSDISYTLVRLDTMVQAVAVRLQTPVALTVCNVYIPNVHWTNHQLSALWSQLQDPILLTGDFNAHHPLWDKRCTQPDASGRRLEDFIDHEGLIILNTGDPTRFEASTGSMSAIDLALASPTAATQLSWSVMDDLHQSDHFPTYVLVTTTETPQQASTFTPRWLTDGADWDKFQDCFVCPPLTGDVDEDVEALTESIIGAAEESIQQSHPPTQRRRVPWWNAECQAANMAKKRALRIFRRYPTEDNRITFRRLRAAERRTFLVAQRSTFREFTSTITVSTPTRQVWNKIKAISGKFSPHKLPSLLRERVCHTNPSTVSEILVDDFAAVSASAAYDERFLMYKTTQEQTCLNFDEVDPAAYNLPLTMEELERVIGRRAETAPGQDRVTFSMLQHLPLHGKLHLLSIFNNIWTSSTYPKSWQTSIVVPIHKNGKDPCLLSSYRAISLTSCMGKTLESMVNRRLVWALESQRLLSPSQAGFRQHHSTTDQLVLLDHHIQTAFRNRQHALAVFFDLEKAYDMTWRYGILSQLSQWGFRGRLPLFIQGFLRHREFQVRVGSALSEPRVQENGIPQGSVLSVTLFGVAVNALSNSIPSSIVQTLYVDDLCILLTGSNMTEMGETMQDALNSLSDAAQMRGFKFSNTKTCCVHFCRLRRPHEAPILRLNGSELQYTASVKFLGLHMDATLRWSTHIQHIRTNARKSLNILRLLAGHKWGADSISLLRLYKSLLCSRLEYGVEVYSAASSSRLKTIDQIYHQGMRIVLGAYRTSPVTSMYSLAGELPPNERRVLSCLNYGLRLTATPSNRNSKLFSREEDDPERPPPQGSLAGRFRKYIHGLELTTPPMLPHMTPHTPPWTYRVEVNQSLSRYVKENTPHQVYRTELQRILEQFHNACVYYTDGSRTSEGTGCAVYCQEILELWPLPPQASVHTAELTAIRKATQMHLRSADKRDAVICTDSLSATHAILDRFSSDPYVIELHERMQALYQRGSRCVVIWIPGHIDIEGNEAADYGARRATSFENSINLVAVRWTDVRNSTRTAVQRYWQQKWTESRGKLRNIKHGIESWLQRGFNRKDTVTITRLRIGHTRLTHSHLLLGRPPPDCPFCGDRVSVHHLLTECPHMMGPLRNYGLPNDLNSLLGKDSPHLKSILNILCEKGIFTDI